MTGYVYHPRDRVYVETSTAAYNRKSKERKTDRLKNIFLGSGLAALVAANLINQGSKPEVREDFSNKTKNAYHQMMKEGITVTKTSEGNYQATFKGAQFDLVPYQAGSERGVIGLDQILRRTDKSGQEVTSDPLRSDMHLLFSAIRSNQDRVETLKPGESINFESGDINTSLNAGSRYLIPAYSLK